MKHRKGHMSKHPVRNGYQAPERISARKRNVLIDAYAKELDEIRSRYGYSLTNDKANLWDAARKVPAVQRKRMVRLMRMIDFVMGAYVPTYPYWSDAPSRERYHWRCKRVPIDGSAGHHWKSFSSPLYQIREKP